MPKLPSQVESLRLAFGRLSQQEQFMVLAGAGALVLVTMLGLGWGVSSAIAKAERRVEVKTEQLMQVLQLQGEYRTRVEQDKSRRNKIPIASKVRLVSVVEGIARQAGVEIGQLRPEDGDPSADGIIESRVDLRASNLSADRLQDFLERLEKAPGVVVVRRVKVTKPYRRDTLNIELTVTAYKRKE